MAVKVLEILLFSKTNYFKLNEPKFHLLAINAKIKLDYWNKQKSQKPQREGLTFIKIDPRLLRRN